MYENHSRFPAFCMSGGAWGMSAEAKKKNAGRGFRRLPAFYSVYSSIMFTDANDRI